MLTGMCSRSRPSLQAYVIRPYPGIPLHFYIGYSRKNHPPLPIGALLGTKFGPVSKIDDISIPLLILHGNKDKVVPIESGRQLYQATNGPKEFFAIPRASHNKTYMVGGEGYFPVLCRFLTGLVKKTSQ